MLVIFQIASVNTSLFFLLICVIWISSKVNKAQMKCILHKKWRQWVVEYSVQGLLNDYLKGLAFKINIVISNTFKALRYLVIYRAAFLFHLTTNSSILKNILDYI